MFGKTCFFFELFDLVSEVGRALEFELAGSFLHFSLEFFEDFGGVVDHLVFGHEPGVDFTAFAGGFVVGVETFCLLYTSDAADE